MEIMEVLKRFVVVCVNAIYKSYLQSFSWEIIKENLLYYIVLKFIAHFNHIKILLTRQNQ